MVSPAPHSGVTSEPLPAGEPGTADSAELEVALGHLFGRKELLAQALTHRSLAYEKAGPDRTAGDGLRPDNDGREFWGAGVGALFLDGGIAPVERLIEAHVLSPSAEKLRKDLLAGEGIGDFKSALQELLQARKQGQPEYRTTAETGPDHRKRFFVEARAGGEALA